MTRRSSFPLLLAATAGLTLSLEAPPNRAQTNEVNVQFHGFQDTRDVTVLTPTVDVAQDLTDRTNLRLKYGVDAISAASDSCVRCHRDGIDSNRQLLGLSVAHTYGDTKITVGGDFSKENFYRATTGFASISRNLASGSTTVAGGFSLSLNQPTRHPLEDIENQYQAGAFGSVTQILSKTTIVQAGYEVGRFRGYLDNPYLRSEVNGELVLGHVPDSRLRHTISARLRQALPADTYLEADYRHYFDDWEVQSNTLYLGLSHHFGPAFVTNIGFRRYDQTGAFFWAPQYSGNPEFYTADFRLEPFTSNNVSGRVEFTPKRRWWWLPEGTSLMGQYERYHSDNGFTSSITSTGLRVPLKLFLR